MNKRFASLSAVTGAVVVSATAAMIAAPAAQADTRVVLPAQKQTLTMGDGTKVTMFRTGERATVNASVGGTPLHRNAAVSGKYEIRTSEPVKKIQVRAGYIVGCQVNVGGMGHSMDGNADAGASATSNVTTENMGETITLGPGQAAVYYITDTEKADDFGNEKHEPKVTYKKKQRVRFSYYNSQLTLNGCGGYAQARSTANVLIETKHATEWLTFFGRPFAMG